MLKKIGKIVLLVLIFVGGFAVGLGGKFYIDEWRAARNVTLWMDSLDPFKNDTYGGATPEETFDMYLSALKKGDLELASRYFYVTKQENRLKDLQEMKIDNELSGYISELSSVKKDSWKKEEFNDQIMVQYSGYRSQEREISVFDNDWKVAKKKLLIGNFDDSMIFWNINNKENKIWKIYSL